MLTNKIFMRKTKRGNILKIVREHYLRDDIGCGAEFCDYCTQARSDMVLVRNPAIESNLFKFPHYIVLDTNVVHRSR